MKTLKDHFNRCFDLFHTWNRVGWNLITQMFEVELEVWDEIIKVIGYIINAILIWLLCMHFCRDDEFNFWFIYICINAKITFIGEA